jgi:methyltransferase-like protein
VAHGVYSWVPPNVRKALLAISASRLTPHGIAYISYNCLPGCHIRRMVREIMRFHIRTESDPRQQLQQAVAVTRFIANSMEKPDAYRQVFKEQLEQIQRYGAGFLFHDDLAEINDPVYFHEFMAQADAHGLQYLAEADFYEMSDHVFTSGTRQTLGGMTDSRVTLEQYLDFIKCRRFRQTLLCRRETPVSHPPKSDAVQGFHISSDARPEAGKDRSPASNVARFVTSRGGALELDYPPGKAAFRILAQQWPATVPFDELFLGAIQEKPAPDHDELAARQALASILLEGYGAGVVDFRKSPIRCAATVPERPRVWDFARQQIRNRDSITTLRGDNLRIGDAEGKRLLNLLDGTRGLEEIRAQMESQEPEGNDGDSNRLFMDRLNDLARFALLEKPEPISI